MTFSKNITLGMNMMCFQGANKLRRLQNARARISFCFRKPATSCGFLRVACAWILQDAKTSLRLEVNLCASISGSFKLACENLYQDGTQHGARKGRTYIFPAPALTERNIKATNF